MRYSLSFVRRTFLLAVCMSGLDLYIAWIAHSTSSLFLYLGMGLFMTIFAYFLDPTYKKVKIMYLLTWLSGLGALLWWATTLNWVRILDSLFSSTSHVVFTALGALAIAILAAWRAINHEPWPESAGRR